MNIEGRRTNIVRRPFILIEKRRMKMLLDVSTRSSNIEIPSSNLIVGSDVQFSGIDWIVVHDDGECVYLMTKDILFNCQFSHDSNVFAYKKSDVIDTCFRFSCTLGVEGNPKFKSWTQDGVNACCHVISYDNANGGYNYFSRDYFDSNRIANNRVGDPADYWCSTYEGTMMNSMYVVTLAGSIDFASPNHWCGFRPVIAYIK